MIKSRQDYFPTHCHFSPKQNLWMFIEAGGVGTKSSRAAKWLSPRKVGEISLNRSNWTTAALEAWVSTSLRGEQVL